MNDRPDRDSDRRTSERIADRLVHPRDDGRGNRHDDGLSDTGPLVPPPRADAVPSGTGTAHASGTGAAHGPSGTGAAHDDAPAGRPGDLPDAEPPATDADRAVAAGSAASGGAHAANPDPAHSGAEYAAVPDGATGDRTTSDGPLHESSPVPEPSAPRSSARLSLLDEDPEDVRRRWQEVQVGFVDDPRRAVERADSLLDEVTAAIRSALEARASDLRSRWKNAEQADTELLRTALRDYRSVLEQLLELSAPSTASGGAPAPSPASPMSSRKR
ncbi:hypothetical protein Ppa06_62510 [Planomonospora parontospora subsp. parontospora]|uniref:Uncharacterized protein n=2 Tax=Planomonospora parontospora TaxID=58119 RepID=A0AA37BC57_9ACTN|nr:hypothetical protein [Planomonospora parontospora]GGK49320.1 hypothetical protein GCM10010126_06150 [Planomonospora parontospora]GII12453.1 hypothetical protein Ppa06_62510 [Planomonospora parontospora subsp. parontospora]